MRASCLTFSAVPDACARSTGGRLHQAPWMVPAFGLTAVGIFVFSEGARQRVLVNQ